MPGVNVNNLWHGAVNALASRVDKVDRWAFRNWDLALALLFFLAALNSLYRGLYREAIPAAVAFGAILLWRAPTRQLQRQAMIGVSPDRLLELENELRRTIAQMLAGIAVLGGLYFTWKQLVASEQGQITERFSRAVEQLSDTSVALRLGGIYALERIAEDSPRDHWPVMEILTAYLRQGAPIPSGWKGPTECTELGSVTSSVTPVLSKPAADVQAVLTVLGRRKESRDQGVLDLSETLIIGAHLKNAQLGGVSFRGSHLTGVTSTSSVFNQADFSQSVLVNTRFEESDLSHSSFYGSSMRGGSFLRSKLDLAMFTTAHVNGVGFYDSDVRGGSFQDACLLYTRFEKTFMGNADLRGSNLLQSGLKPAEINASQLDEMTILPRDHRDGSIEVLGEIWLWAITGDFLMARANRAPPRLVFWRSEDPAVRFWKDLDTLAAGSWRVRDSLQVFFMTATGRTVRDSSGQVWHLQFSPAKGADKQRVLVRPTVQYSGRGVWLETPNLSTLHLDEEDLDMLLNAARDSLIVPTLPKDRGPP